MQEFRQTHSELLGGLSRLVGFVFLVDFVKNEPGDQLLLTPLLRSALSAEPKGSSTLPLFPWMTQEEEFSFATWTELGLPSSQESLGRHLLAPGLGVSCPSSAVQVTVTRWKALVGDLILYCFPGLGVVVAESDVIFWGSILKRMS